MSMIFPMSPHRAEEYFFRFPIKGERALMKGDIPYFLGRYAMYHGLRALHRQNSSRQTVLIPSFHCGSLVEAALAAGLRCEFYPISREGTILMDELAQRLHQDILAVMVIHYYGWPADLFSLQRLVEGKGISIVEDCAHALFSKIQGEPIGRIGDFAIYSLRKSIPVTDGGILRLNRSDLSVEHPSENAPSIRSSISTIVRAFGGSSLLKSIKNIKTPMGRKKAPKQGKTIVGEANQNTNGEQQDFALNQAKLGISFFSRYIALRVDPAEIVEDRRSSYFRLYRLLEGHPRFRPMFPQLPSGVCPLALVLIHPNRDEIEKNLLKRGVETFTFGRIPHRLMKLENFSETQLLCDQSLALPIHQGLSENDIDELAKIVLDVI